MVMVTQHAQWQSLVDPLSDGACASVTAFFNCSLGPHIIPFRWLMKLCVVVETAFKTPNRMCLGTQVSGTQGIRCTPLCVHYQLSTCLCCTAGLAMLFAAFSMVQDHSGTGYVASIIRHTVKMQLINAHLIFSSLLHDFRTHSYGRPTREDTVGSGMRSSEHGTCSICWLVDQAQPHQTQVHVLLAEPTSISRPHQLGKRKCSATCILRLRSDDGSRNLVLASGATRDCTIVCCSAVPRTPWAFTCHDIGL